MTPFALPTPSFDINPPHIGDRVVFESGTEPFEIIAINHRAVLGTTVTLRCMSNHLRRLIDVDVKRLRRI